LPRRAAKNLFQLIDRRVEWFMTGAAAEPAMTDSQMQSEVSSQLERQAILVLGMHRSGTSAVAGVLGVLGAALPKKTLMGPDPCNQRGLFEALALACAHDELLLSAHSHWHDWRQIDPQWLRSPAALRHRQRIMQVLADEFEDEAFIVLKDPRICRFAPFTRSVLADLNYRCAAILPLRNPLEVALSLQRRNGFALSKSGLLWLRHVLDAEFYSRGMPRSFLSYAGFLRDWRSVLDRLTDELGIAWPGWSDDSSLKVDQFLTDELYHERAPFDRIEDRTEFSSLILDTYTILLKIVAAGETDELLNDLDRVRNKFDEGCRIFGAALAAEELATADKNLIAERDSIAAAFGKLTSEYQALLASNGKITAADDASSDRAPAAEKPEFTVSGAPA
jgi:hypothetical protein